MDKLEWLMEWYLAQCDGNWEHEHGLQIATLDNPGWSMAVDLKGTDLEGRSFEPVQQNEPDGDTSWWACKIENEQWRGACGPKDLSILLRLFRDWATSN